MDLFWFIPAVIVGVGFVWGFYLHVTRRSSSLSTPNVLVHKPSDEPAIDPSAESHDWKGRPCGSFLDWRAKANKSAE